MEKERFNSRLTELTQTKVLANYSLIYLLDIPRDKDIVDLSPNVGINEMYIFIRNISLKPLRMGDSFQVLVPINNPSSYLEIPILIKYFSMNKSFEIEELYGGYSAIALLEFKDGIPPIINEMREYMSEWNSESESFYLMDRELLEVVLNQNS